MTHQLKVLFPGVLRFFEPVYQFISYHLIKKFDECWIPDYEGDVNLSGELSHSASKLKNIYYIGPLSKFISQANEKRNPKHKILFILSGPEPQRTILEKKIYQQTVSKELDCVLVRGTSQECQYDFKYPVYDILNTKELFSLIISSELVVCRSGYSSVMDLFLLKKKAVYIPTPGQTEQEYLAQYLQKRGLFYSMSQQEFDLNELQKNAFDFPKTTSYKTNGLEKRLEALNNMYCK